MSGPGRKLKLLRAAHGLSQDDLAAALGEKPSKIRDIEAGRQRLNDTFIATLTRHFPVDLNWLFAAEDSSAFAARKPAPTAFAEGRAEHDIGRREPLRAGFLPVPWHDAVRREQATGSAPVALAADALAAQGLDPADLVAVAPQDFAISAGPGLVALVRPDARRAGAGLWCVLVGGRSLIAQVQFQGDLLVILPGGAEAAARALPMAQVEILGEVIWTGYFRVSAAG